MSTKTQTTRGPSARARRAAQTAESTPPERPQTTRSDGPTLRTICSSDRSMNAPIVQFRGFWQIRSRKLPRISEPYGVCETSG